ncbi:MAG: hypothetical protein ACRDPR_17045, partial [Nocardioidaceae bacterium]
VLGAGAVVLLGGSDDDGDTGGEAASAGRHALVSTVNNNPGVNVFYGTSCTGLRGSWFLNIVQGGGSDARHAAYYLRWSFSAADDVARPGGRITISGGAGEPPTATLEDGEITLAGTRSDGSPVSGTGQLEVRLTGTGDEPTLTISQTGLDEAIGALGLASPFSAGGRPLTVPVKLVDEVSGC